MWDSSFSCWFLLWLLEMEEVQGWRSECGLWGWYSQDTGRVVLPLGIQRWSELFKVADMHWSSRRSSRQDLWEFHWVHWYRSVMPDSLGPHGLQPARLLCPRSLQARILEWFAISFFRDLPDPGIKPGSPILQVNSLSTELPGKLIESRAPTVFLHLLESQPSFGGGFLSYSSCSGISISLLCLLNQDQLVGYKWTGVWARCLILTFSRIILAWTSKNSFLLLVDGLVPFLPLGLVCVRGGHPKWPVAKEIPLLVSESPYKFGTRIILASWIIFFLGLARELLFHPIGTE